MSAPGESAKDPLIGKVVDGRYHILRLIGRGGMGVVYEAEATRLGRRLCAVKVLLPEFTSSDTAVARFSREAELAGRVKHANVVEIFDTGTTADGRGYLAMELLRGESLDRTLRREGPLPWARARHIIIQICRALAIAHAEKIVHRDMKPENCFRGERDGDPDFIKVLDFGIAKLTETAGSEELPRLTATHAVIGTYAYMANEQVRGEEIDHRVDVWALGVMLYEMLTGRLPFRGSNQGQIWTAISSYDPEPMRNIAPDAAIPEAAEAIVRRALARTRNDRFPTVDALARAIAEVQADNPAVEPGRPALQALTSVPTTSPTFVSGPTAAATAAPGRPLQNSRTAPVSPHGLTALSPGEADDTGEHLCSTPHPSVSEGRDPGPPREVMETATAGPPSEPPALVAPSTPALRNPRRAAWLLAGLGLPSIGLALWLAQTPVATLAPQPAVPLAPNPTVLEPAKVAVVEPRLAPHAEPHTPAPVTLPPAPGPPPAPAPVESEPIAPTVADKPVVLARNKRTEGWASRVKRALDSLRSSSKLADCFGTMTVPMEVDVKVAAETGVASVSVPAQRRGSVLDLCIQRVFQAKPFPVGGPSDLDFESKKFVLNRQ